jgi:diacylglycerol kinase (ATP)
MNRHTNVLQSAGSAVKGARHGLIGRNFRILACVGAAALALAYYLPLAATERYIVILLVAVVLAGELFNTALEEIADTITQDHHAGIARAKELASGGMLVLCFAAGVIGLALFAPYL